MGAIVERTGKIDWNALLARAAKKEPFERSIGAGKVTGVVVSIGVLHRDGTSIPENVLRFVRGLGDSAAATHRISEDEFALIWRGESGAAAQQRLGRISQELWDFQLGSIGDLPVVFSWGGVEVENEPMDEALASASMKMQETRRGRKALVTGKLRAGAVRPS
jgi:hypothetical protein